MAASWVSVKASIWVGVSLERKVVESSPIPVTVMASIWVGLSPAREVVENSPMVVTVMAEMVVVVMSASWVSLSAES